MRVLARECPSYPRYYATIDGRVLSMNRRQDDSLLLELTATEDAYGYLVATVRREDGKQVRRRVHVLVADAWHGPRPAGMEVCHNNSTRLDNRPENLRYDTRAGNVLDAMERIHLDGNDRIKLNPVAVREIRRLRVDEGLTNKQLSDRFQVGEATVSRIINRRSWAHVA